MAKPSVLEQLAAYAPADRPGAVVHAMRQLARRASRDIVLIARLAHEAHMEGYWSKVGRANGQPYLSEEEFFAEVLDMPWRTALKRMAIGRALAAFPETSRDDIADKLADLGAARATILVPAIEKEPDAVGTWIERATTLSVDELQAQVSRTMGVRPMDHSDKDRVADFLRGAMPSIETRETFDEFLKAGRKITGSDSTVGVLIAAFQECLGAWQGQGK